MASQPPTGYNPEVSLLQGGTASIQPVQGGGGMEGGSTTPPPGFNPGVSMLEGGTTPIKPISGGGQEGGVGFKNGPNVRTYDPNAPPANVGKAAKAAEAPKPPAVVEVPKPPAAVVEAPKPPAAVVEPTKPPPKPANVKGPFGGYVVEKYELKEEIVTVPAFESGKYQKLVASYGTETSTFLLETPTTKKVYKGTESSAPTLDKYSETPKNATFHKLIPQRVTFLEDDTPYIWIFPNIEGNIGKFMNAMKLVPRDDTGAIAPHHYVVFTGQFFAAPGNTNNLVLYQEFLSYKVKAPGVSRSKIFILLQPTDANYKIGKELTDKGFPPKFSTRNQQLFLPYNEPSVIIFTKQHIVLQSDTLPVGINSEAVRTSELLKDKTLKSGLLEGKDSVYISPKLGAYDFMPGASDETNPYFTITGREDAEVYKPVKADIVCPKTSKDKCGGFKEAYKVPELGNKRRFPAPELYLLYKNTNGLPFRAPPGSVRDISDVSGAAPLPAVAVVKPLDVSGTPVKTLVGILKKIAPLAPQARVGAFVPSLNAKSAYEETIELNMKRYKLRSALPEIMNDWKKGIFTEGEVEFLEDLQFSPTLLGDAITTGDWKEELSDFLQSIVESNCFQDTTLLVKSQCSKAEQLVQSIYFQMYNQALQELYDAEAAFKPPAMAKIYNLLKSLASVSKDIEIQNITSEEFTGDLLGRRYDMRFNPTSKQFFTNIAELQEKQIKAIQDLKFKRMLSPDISALLAAFQTKDEGSKAAEAVAAEAVAAKAVAAEAAVEVPAVAAVAAPAKPSATGAEAAETTEAAVAKPPGSTAGGSYPKKTRAHRFKQTRKTRKGKKSS